MAKPIFNSTQYELRNELPVVVSDEQQSAITLATERVNEQLGFVAQMLGWSGPNYWDNLPKTVNEKRALLNGSFGVYNNYTLLRLLEIQTWNQSVITEFKPNIAIGQRVIIGDQQAYIYNLERQDDTLILNLGTLSERVLELLESGAAIKVDCPENRPFPFYRPEALASGDADFRCSTGDLLRSNNFYDFFHLVLSPYSQNNTLVPYTNLQLYGGSYYYFDRAVYLALEEKVLAPWVECQWIESKGLWELYVPPTIVGNRVYLVWPYAAQAKKSIAYVGAQVIAWENPSDWGNAGQGFNPVLDVYRIEKTYDTAGLNYSLGTSLHLGDNPPIDGNPLWFDAGSQIVYSFNAGQWVAVGVASGQVDLSGPNEPPPANYELSPGSIWQDPKGQVYVWDSSYVLQDFYYIFSNGIENGFFIINPSYNVGNFYYFNPDNFYIHCPNYADVNGFATHNLILDPDGFYISDPCVKQLSWAKVNFYNDSLFQSVFTPAYNTNLQVLVNGVEVPAIYTTDNFTLSWGVDGFFLKLTYTALTEQGEYFVPSITVRSDNGVNTSFLDLSSDFKARPVEVTSVPYNELGVLNNFQGVWGNKGGPRSLDLCFDALDIHAFDEQQALYLKPVNQVVNFDWMLQQVSGKQVFVGDQPPSGAKVGDYYWNNETGALAVLYVDRDRNNVWVEVNYPISICQVGTPDCDYFPLKPVFSTGSCVLDNGDMWQDPVTTGVALYYEGLSFNPYWVEINWNPEINGGGSGWSFSQAPDPVPDFTVLTIYVTDDFIPLQPDEIYTTADYNLSYTIDISGCQYVFSYTAISPTGVQSQPTIWVGPSNAVYFPVQITEYVFSSVEYFLGPAVQNASSVLRPWKTQSLEVTDEVTLTEETYLNPLRADTNCGPGDEDWTRSFIRLPAEYGRENTKWNQAELIVENFTYAGTDGSLKEMQCPTNVIRPQIYGEVVFKRSDPGVGALLYDEPFLFSDVEGFTTLSNFFAQQESGEFVSADFDYVGDDPYDEWAEADLKEYDPLHYRQVFANGDWQGVYLEPTGSRPLTGFIERDLRVKTVIPVAAPIWDASIYKYPPLCPQGPESYEENPNNCKVGYAYFAADLAAAEDGFFDQSQDVAWREPLVEDQTLYILNN